LDDFELKGECAEQNKVVAWNVLKYCEPSMIWCSPEPLVQLTFWWLW